MLILREHRKPNAFRKGPLHGVICLVWHHSLLYNFSPVTMETCCSVAVIVNQDLSLFPFHHEALYPYGLNHSSHWQWHRSNIIATHKTLSRSLSFPPITGSRECQLKSNFYKEIKVPLGSSAIYPHDRMPSRGGRGLLSFRLALAYGKSKHHFMSLPTCVCRYKSRQEVVSVWPLAPSSIPFLCLHIRHLTETTPIPHPFIFSVQLSLSFWSIFCIPSCCFSLGRLCQAGEAKLLPRVVGAVRS